MLVKCLAQYSVINTEGHSSSKHRVRVCDTFSLKTIRKILTGRGQKSGKKREKYLSKSCIFSQSALQALVVLAFRRIRKSNHGRLAKQNIHYICTCVIFAYVWHSKLCVKSISCSGDIFTATHIIKKETKVHLCINCITE